MPRIAFLASGALAALLAAAPQPQAEVVVTISKSQQQLAVTVDGTERYRWPVSTGRRGLETPSGDFRPIRFERKWYSRRYDWSPMPWSIFFNRGYAVHGTLEARHLGRPVSHGCVRLLPVNASILFKLVRGEGQDGTRIVVTNDPLPAVSPAPPPDADPMANIAADPRPVPVQKEATLAASPEITVPLPALLKPQFAAPPLLPRKADIPPPEPAKPAAAVPLSPPRPVVAAPAQTVRPHVVRAHAAHAPVAKPRFGNEFTAVGNEAAVMRGREAWLRSLDRKYGIRR